MIFYNKIKEFVRKYFPNKKQKEKNKQNLLLARGFGEGCYDFEEDTSIDENSMRKDNLRINKLEELTEEQISKMMGNAGVF